MSHWPSRQFGSVLPITTLLTVLLLVTPSVHAEEDYNIQHNDGSYEFGYENENNFHHSKANSRNVVRGEFGGRNPKTGGVDVTQYTAGPRGYRPRGSNIVRKFDQSQVRRGPIGSRDDPYFDPNEDPTYNFGFKTRTYQRKESANRAGDVNGQYSYIDDVGERHNVEYIAGKKTGFHVKTPFPDSNPKAYGPLFFNGRGRPIPRGRTSIQSGQDGSYRFVAAGPDQRRTEVSDSHGNVRGSYTYLDDKGVQHSVHYIAGPGIGYRVLKNVRGPHLPSVYPFTGPNIVPSGFYNYLDKHSQGDVFNAPEVTSSSFNYDTGYGTDYGADGGYGAGRPSRPNQPGGKPFAKPSVALPKPQPSGKPVRPSYDYDDDSDFGGDDLFGGSSGVGSTTARPLDGIGEVGGTAGIGSKTKPSTESTATGEVSSEDVSAAGSGITDSDAEAEDNYKDNGDDLFGGSPSVSALRPKPSTLRPSNNRPNSKPSQDSTKPSSYDDDAWNINDLDNGLFGGSSGVSSFNQDEAGTTGTPKPHIISITGTGGKKSIVTNLGDRTFTVPPGVSVHAHVQSIDLFPYESKVPTPADQFRSETTRSFQRLTTRQVNRQDEKLFTALPVQKSFERSKSTTLLSIAPTTSTALTTTTEITKENIKQEDKDKNEVKDASEEYEVDYDSNETTEASMVTTEETQ